MYKWRRWYNQNRTNFWIVIIIILFIFIIIRLLNFWSKLQIEEERKKAEEENMRNEISYKENSKSMVSGGSVDKQYEDIFGKLIDSFLNNCVNQNYEEAYNLLSKQCKEELYPSKKIFVDQYCSEKFEGDKQYNFQSWTSKGNYIYLIKIYENMLSSGNAKTNYIQDYYTIIKEDGEYKLNISSFIGNQKYANKFAQKNGIKINVNNTSVYMDYQLYKLTIKNNTESTIMLDTREKTNQTYAINSNNIKIEALLHENKEEDLIIKPGEEKTITIKFSNVYQYETDVKKIVFNNIVQNYEEYCNNSDRYDKFEVIEIEI